MYGTESQKQSRQEQILSTLDPDEEFTNSTEEYGKSEIDRIVQSLDLDDSVKNYSEMVFEQSRENDMGHGRSTDSIVSSSIYIACRDTGSGVSIDNIANMSAVSESDISRTAQDIADELNIHIQLADPSEYVDRFFENVNDIRGDRSEELLNDDVKERAHEICELSNQENIISGRSPTGVAAGALYLASKQIGDRVSQSDIAEAAGVCEVTVRKRYQEQEKYWSR